MSIEKNEHRGEVAKCVERKRYTFEKHAHDEQKPIRPANADVTHFNRQNFRSKKTQ